VFDGREDGRHNYDQSAIPAPGEEKTSTSQGHPRTIFRRALEHDNLVLADVTAREIGRIAERSSTRTCSSDEPGIRDALEAAAKVGV